MANETIGFIGLGLMGHGMARNIVEKGYPLTVIAHRNRQPVEDLVERLLLDEERIVLGRQLLVRVDEVERDVVVGLDGHERAEGLRLPKAEDLGEELRRRLLVVRPHDRVVQLDGHGAPPRSISSCLSAPRTRPRARPTARRPSRAELV